MNRERAEAFLRLLAEAEMRDPLAGQPQVRRGADAPAVVVPVKVARVAWALVAVDALDSATAETIMSDLELALAARTVPEPLTVAQGQPAQLFQPRPVPQRFPLRPPRIGRLGPGA